MVRVGLPADWTSGPLMDCVSTGEYSDCGESARTSGDTGRGSWVPQLAVSRLASLLLSAAALASVCATLPVAADASLPDGRVYEQVSPADKNGNVVGQRTGSYEGEFSLAAASGNAVIYGGGGAMGSASSGGFGLFVSRRSPGVGWQTQSATPTQLPTPTVYGGPNQLVPSADFSRFIFGSGGPYSPEQPLSPESSVNLYITENPFQAPTWIGKPTIAGPIPRPGFNFTDRDYILAGATPNLETVYFTYSGTLIPQDESRAPYVREGEGTERSAPWGFYEWHAGALSSAGVLPNGTIDAFGAVPAAIAGFGESLAGEAQRVNGAFQASSDDNQVSGDGSRAFFVSPDPQASTVTNSERCTLEPPCTSEPPELYVREASAGGSHRAVLVSQSHFPGHSGEPAPDGPVAVENASGAAAGGARPGATYVYGSPDGSHAFFTTKDQLTSDAPGTTLVHLSDEGLTGGVFTLTVDVNGVSRSTGSLPDGASAGEVQSALEGLANVGPGHVTVAGALVTFTGLEPAPVGLTANPQTFGYSLPEEGAFTLTVAAGGASDTTAPLGQGASAAQVQSALEALDDVGAGNVTVTSASGGGTVTFAAAVADSKLSLSAQSKQGMNGGLASIIGPNLVAVDVTPTKVYEFDLENEELTYLPGVSGPIIASDTNGSRFMFENTATAIPELDLWSASPGGGQVKRVVQLSSEKADATPARATEDGSAFLFQTSDPLPGFNNAGEFRQIYRYDVTSEEIACVSCPPHGVTPSGSPSLGYDNIGGTNAEAASTFDTRGMSSNGKRVFFDTPDPFVPQDTNGQRDVYEWEQDGEGSCVTETGCVFLISIGTSPEGSLIADSSASGGDVFFVTTSGIASGDRDGGDDIYDARIPQPGDNPPPSAVPCQGEVCQGPPSVPQLFGAPASSTFNGEGNGQAPVQVSKAKPKTKPTGKCKKGFVRKKGKCVRDKAKRPKAKKTGNDRRTKS